MAGTSAAALCTSRIPLLVPALPSQTTAPPHSAPGASHPHVPEKAVPSAAPLHTALLAFHPCVAACCCCLLYPLVLHPGSPSPQNQRPVEVRRSAFRRKRVSDEELRQRKEQARREQEETHRRFAKVRGTRWVRCWDEATVTTATPGRLCDCVSAVDEQEGMRRRFAKVRGAAALQRVSRRCAGALPRWEAPVSGCGIVCWQWASRRRRSGAL